MADYEMPRVGDVIAGKYRLEKVAGEGGMGVVYAAEHLVLRQRVAVKVLLPDAATSELVIERFAREAQAAARIQSEHVARVMDAGSTATGAPFLVMEYLDGCDLEELLDVEGPLPVAEVADYLLQALEALAHAHAVGLVHRDIKPANLFLACRPDGGNVIKMLDFGISKAVRSTPEQKVLTGQAVLGSPVYMSPEQLRNAKDLDARADLWSLGVVAYELLAGRPPFDGEGVGEIFAAILEKDPTPLHLVNPRLTPALSEVIGRCLARKTEDRWSDAGALARALLPFGSGAFAGVVDRAEQVLARARMMKQPETPPEARHVVAALVEVAERARTTGGAKGEHATRPEIELVTPKIAAEEGAAGDRGMAESLRARLVARTPMARWIGASLAAAIVVGGVAAVAAVRAGKTVAAGTRTPLAAVAVDPRSTPRGPSGPSATSDDGADKDPAAAGDDSAPMVMDLPSSPASSGPRRSGRPGRPQRPKFLNTRE